MTSLVGGFAIQLCLGLIICGITYSQAYTYYLMSAKDPWLIKATVATVVILESANSVFSISMMYTTLIQNFGNYLGLIEVAWSVKGASLAIIATISFARAFNVYRVYQVSRGNRLLTSLAGFISLSNTVIGFGGGTVALLRAKTWPEFLANKGANINFILSMGLGVFDDILISSTLIYSLYRMKTGFNRTDRLITVMIVYVVNTGAMTAVISASVIVMYYINKDSFLYQGAYCLAGRIYGVAVIGTLNQRMYFKNTEAVVVTDGGIPISAMNQSRHHQIENPIQILQKVERHADGGDVLNISLHSEPMTPASSFKLA